MVLQLNVFPEKGKALVSLLLLLACLGVTSCGLLSTQREAYQDYEKALQVSGIHDIKVSPQGPQLSPSDMDRLEKGLALVEKAIATDPYCGHGEAHKLAIFITSLLGRDEETDRLFQHAIALFPDRADLRSDYVLYMKRMDGDPDRMIELVRDGLLRSPGYMPLQNLLATLLVENERDPDEVEQIAMKMLKEENLPFTQLVFVGSLGAFLAENNHLEHGARLWLAVAKRSPKAARSAMMLVLQEGRVNGMEALFDHTFARLDNTHVLLPAWLWFLIMNNRLEEGEKVLQEALALEEELSPFFPGEEDVFRGWIDLSRGDARMAADRFEAVLDSRPAALDALEGLMRIYQQNPQLVPFKGLRDRFEAALRSVEDPMEKDMLIRMIEYLRDLP